MFMEKYAENVYQKLVPDLFSTLVNSPKCNQYIKETFVNKKNLKEDYQKVLKNLFLWTKKRGLDFVTSPFSHCPICSEVLVIHHLARLSF